MKEVFKRITDKLSRTVRLSPTELERQIILAKIEVMSDHIDMMALEFENRLIALEEKKFTKKEKKHV